MAQLSSAAELKASWGLILFRGVMTILFGILLITNPGRTLVAFTNVMAFFLLIDGIVTLIGSLLGRNWWSLIGAIILIVIAIFVLGHPILITTLAASTLLLFMGISSILSGGVNLYGVFQNRHKLENWGWIALNAALMIIFGLLILFGNTLFVGMLLLQIIGIYMIIAGIVLIVFAFRVHNS